MYHHTPHISDVDPRMVVRTGLTSPSCAIIQPLWMMFVIGFSTGTPVTVCDEQSLLIDCLPGRVIVIESAVYGRTTRDACAASDSTYCHESVLAQIQTSCFPRRECRVVVKPTMISPEPCQGTPKYLNISYECISGK